jgi:hypothetical protein
MSYNLYNPFLNPGPLFGRAYVLLIGAPNQTNATQYGTQGKNPSPLRIKFDINKNLVGSANKSKIEIYNMSSQSRNSIKKGYLVMLKAGYQSLIDTIFIGNVLPDGIGSKREGSEIVTTLECGDGEGSIVMANLDRSYGPGITPLQILKDIANAMNLPNSINPSGIGNGVVFLTNNNPFNRGFVARGPCSKTLDKLLKPMGLEWSVQNGNLNIIPITGHLGNEAIVVSADTGMIGVPSQNAFVTKFSSILNPRLVPGALVQLKTNDSTANSSLNGFYKIREAHYKGDTHENHWGVECTCVRINAQQNLQNVNLLPSNASPGALLA